MAWLPDRTPPAPGCAGDGPRLSDATAKDAKIAKEERRDLLHESAYAVIGAGIEVHPVLGPGRLALRINVQVPRLRGGGRPIVRS